MLLDGVWLSRIKRITYLLTYLNNCRCQFNCRHHAVINDISTQSTKLNKFAISFGRPGPKKASGGFAPDPLTTDQGICPWTPKPNFVSTSVTPSIVKSCVRLWSSLWLRWQACLPSVSAHVQPVSSSRVFIISVRGRIPDLLTSSLLLTWSLHDIRPRCYEFVLLISCLRSTIEVHFKSARVCPVGWRRGVVVTALVVSTKLLYVEPG